LTWILGFSLTLITMASSAGCEVPTDYVRGLLGELEILAHAPSPLALQDYV
jgi:hypothetical protein